VLRLYANMSGIYLSRIQSSTDDVQLLEHIHTLKSAAAGIGAVAVRERSGDAEAALRAGRPVEPARLLAIATAVAECQDFIRDFIAE
jgi:HPt (histidine-containing phosphotransfer) domain-containing protein